MFNDSGEALVNGSSTGHDFSDADWSSWKQVPDWYEELKAGTEKLVNHYGAPVDVEFTVEGDTLYFLQARAAKLTAQAKVKTYLMPNVELTAKDLDDCAVSKMALSDAAPVTQGTPIAGGAVTAKVARTRKAAKEYIENKTRFLFVREDTTPEDLPIMIEAAGFVTKVGSHTSHAALCARALNLPCVINVDIENYPSGSEITICGSTGRIYNGSAKIKPGGLPANIKKMTGEYVKQNYKGSELRVGSLWSGSLPLPFKQWKPTKPTDGMNEFAGILKPTDEHKISQIKEVFEAEVTDLSTTKAIQAFLGEVQTIIYGETENEAPPYIEQFILKALNAQKQKYAGEL